MNRPVLLGIATFAVLSIVARDVPASDLASREPLPFAALGAGGDAPVMEPRLVNTQLVCAGGSALVAMPVAMLAGSLVGTLSNDLVLAAVPALLVYLLVPPAAAAFAARTVGQGSAVMDPGFWKPFGVGVAVHVAITAAAVLLFGTSSRGYVGAALLSIVDAAALAPSVTFTMNAGADPKAATPVTATPPEARALVSMPIVAGSF